MAEMIIPYATDELMTSDGVRYAYKYTPHYSDIDACDLCDLRGNCNEEVCRYWRELSMYGLTGRERIYFKRKEV